MHRFKKATVSITAVVSLLVIGVLFYDYSAPKVDSVARRRSNSEASGFVQANSSLPQRLTQPPNSPPISLQPDNQLNDTNVEKVLLEILQPTAAPPLRYDHRPFIQSAPISKDLSIHRAYFDGRKRTETHYNQTVFFIDANWTIFQQDGIIGCGVGDRRAKMFRIRIPAEWYWIDGHKRKVPFKYEYLYVDCYDLPVSPGDRAFLLYKTSQFSDPIVVDSELPVIFPKPRVQPAPDSTYDATIVSCIKANTNFPPFIGELLRYQKAIDVDHISLITLSTFIKDGGLKKLLKDYPYVIDYIQDGYMDIDMWKEWYNETQKAHEIRLWSESIRKVACSYNYRGTYDYVMPIDTDDFFTPRVAKHTSVKYYLKKYCDLKNDKVGSCMMYWITYYPEYCGINEIPEDGNVTKALKSLESHTPPPPKSIHKTTKLIDATFHEAKYHRRQVDPNLMPGSDKSVRIPRSICTLSHLRKFAKPKSGHCLKSARRSHRSKWHK